MRFYLQRKNKNSSHRAIAFVFDNLVILYVMGPSLLQSWVRIHPTSILEDMNKYKEVEESEAFYHVTKYNSVELIFTSGLEP
jgi:hypothetical protein